MATFNNNAKTPLIDMTPMVDLGFLLLTFFIFTTTFSTPNVMDLNMPTKEKNPIQGIVKQSNTLTLVLGEKNRIFWHQKTNKDLKYSDLQEVFFSDNALRNLIIDRKSLARERDKFTVIIQPTEYCNYKNVVDILDEISITKVERSAIVDLHPEVKLAYTEHLLK